MRLGFILGAVGVVLLLVLGWWLAISNEALAPTEDLGGVQEPTDAELALLEDETEVELDLEASPLPETVTLSAVGSYEGAGVATRSFVDGVFAHTVTADLPAPPVGKFYEGWLVRHDGGAPPFFSTGRLLVGATGEYALTYTNSQDYPEYTQVVITEETEAQGLDNVPEAHVLEGSF